MYVLYIYIYFPGAAKITGASATSTMLGAERVRSHPKLLDVLNHDEKCQAAESIGNPRTTQVFQCNHPGMLYIITFTR